MDKELPVSVWPEWRIVEKIGEGSFGKVYKAERCERGRNFYSAIKIITIPSSQSELNSVRSETTDEKSTRDYFQNLVEECIQEVSTMEYFRGNSHVVSVEDFKVVEYLDEIGWDIYIRMEYLTSFIDYCIGKSLSEEEVIQLGIDLCKTLQYCHKLNIIHRDIKPENIFVSRFGDFKLGDFGIARELERSMSGLSKKGTFSYMAPEMYRGEQYDSRVDIYSLGLVLYKLMNHNRLPFLNLEKQLITYRDKENALARRMSGETPPKPADAGEDFGEIILKACAYRPEQRYQGPEDFRRDLEMLQNGMYRTGNALAAAPVEAAKVSETAKADEAAKASETARANEAAKASETPKGNKAAKARAAAKADEVSEPRDMAKAEEESRLAAEREQMERIWGAGIFDRPAGASAPQQQDGTVIAKRQRYAPAQAKASSVQSQAASGQPQSQASFVQSQTKDASGQSQMKTSSGQQKPAVTQQKPAVRQKSSTAQPQKASARPASRFQESRMQEIKVQELPPMRSGSTRHNKKKKASISPWTVAVIVVAVAACIITAVYIKLLLEDPVDVESDSQVEAWDNNNYTIDVGDTDSLAEEIQDIKSKATTIVNDLNTYDQIGVEGKKLHYLKRVNDNYEQLMKALVYPDVSDEGLYEEYYYWNEELFFAYIWSNDKNADLYYYKDGELIRWIDNQGICHDNATDNTEYVKRGDKYWKKSLKELEPDAMSIG